MPLVVASMSSVPLDYRQKSVYASYNAPTYGALSDYLFPGGFRDYLLTPIIMAGEPLGNQWVKKYVASINFFMMSETHSSISASSCSRSCSVSLALSL